jgi:hypothetical protein
LQNRGRKPAKILEAHGRYYSFDADGKAAKAFHHAAREAGANLSLLAKIRLPGIGKNSTVFDIGPVVRRERFMREHRWELSKHDLDRIAVDFGKKPMVAEKAKDIKGVASKTRKRRS